MTTSSATIRSPSWHLPLLIGFAIVLVSLLFIPPTFSALNYFDPVKRWGWGVIFFAILIRSFKGPDSFDTPVAIVWSGLVWWIIVRSIWMREAWVGVEVLAGWLLPLVALAAGFVAGRKTSRHSFIAGALVIAAALQALLMLLQLTGRDVLFADITRAMEYKPGRMIGTIGYHNQAADFLALCIPAIFLLRIQPWARAGFAAIFLGVIVMTGSRGAIAGSVAGFVVMQLATGRFAPRRMVTTAVALAAVITLAFAYPNTRGRILDVFEKGTEAPAIASRLWMQKVAWAMWVERPWTGWGAGEYARQYTERLGSILPAEKTHPLLQRLVHAREPHNDLLQFAAEFGVVGAAMALALLWLLIRPLIGERKNEDMRAAAGLFVVTYMAIASSVSFTWQTAMAGPLAGFWLGWCATRQVEDARNKFPASRVMALLLSAALVIWMSWDLWLNVRIPKLIETGRAQQAVEEAPPWGFKHQALSGAALASEKKYDEAQEVLTGAYVGYRDALILNNLGHVYVARGELRKAVAVYETWTRSGIEHRKALENLSMVYEKSGDPARAADVLSRRLLLWRDKDPFALGRLASLYHQAGDYGKVLWTVDQLRPRLGVRVEELFPETMNLAGATLIQLGRPAEAVPWLERALAKNPQLLSARKNLDNLNLFTDETDK